MEKTKYPQSTQYRTREEQQYYDEVRDVIERQGVMLVMKYVEDIELGKKELPPELSMFVSSRRFLDLVNDALYDYSIMKYGLDLENKTYPLL